MSVTAGGLYDFDDGTFEHFVRALALEVFGPGVTAFGSGPDGGREATFRGRVSFPSPPVSIWDGYGVIQAKCKLARGSERDGQSWAMEILARELKKYGPKSRRPVPDYFVFATNVSLSSTIGGGKDEASALIAKHLGRLGLRESAVWDANQIRALLETRPALRRRFAVNLTEGDLLASVLEAIGGVVPDVVRLVGNYIERSFRADFASRLDQTGHYNHQEVGLSDVFIDLPCSDRPSTDPPDERLVHNKKLPAGISNRILLGSDARLDPSSISETSGADSTVRSHERILILGPPGSGKSTVGQFVAQVQRAALLLRRPPQLLTEATLRLAEGTKATCSDLALHWPRAPRVPIRVELNRLAKFLAEGTDKCPHSVFDFISRELEVGAPPCKRDVLRIFQAFPVLLILDGLDEVPVAANRGRVVALLEDVLAELRGDNCDVLTIITSRPHGYDSELRTGTTLVQHVLPLSKARALEYVKRYAACRFGRVSPDREAELVDGMTTAYQQRIAQDLLGSPLQVSFMMTIVSAQGSPVGDRWRLLNSYYSTIYLRESQKAVPPYREILVDYRGVIDRLHHDVGLLLQLRGETPELATEMPSDEFSLLARTYLEETGKESSEVDRLVALIDEIARNRLVFLTSRSTGQLSFDVRSLQEYMAAECLMSGDSSAVTKRVRAIATAAYWRNVVLFCVGRCFHESTSRHLQSIWVGLCDELNVSKDTAVSGILAGSRLAVDLLGSGAASQHAFVSRSLARVAIEALDRAGARSEGDEGVESMASLIANAHAPALDALYQQACELSMGQSSVDRSLCGWRLAIALLQRGVSWAKPMTERFWPKDVEDRASILMSTATLQKGGGSWAAGAASEVVPEMPISRGEAVLQSRISWSHAPRWLAALEAILGGRGPHTSTAVLAGDRRINGQFSVRYLSVDDPRYAEVALAVSKMPVGHISYAPVRLAHLALGDSAQQGVVDVLRELESIGYKVPSDVTALRALPWPLAIALQFSHDGVRSLGDVAKWVAEGGMGGLPDWRAAEQRWKKSGIVRDDFASAATLDVARDIATVGLPYICAAVVEIHELGKASAAATLDLARVARAPRGRWVASWWLLRFLHYAGKDCASLDPSEIWSVISGVPRAASIGSVIPRGCLTGDVEGWIRLFDNIGCDLRLQLEYGVKDSTDGLWVPDWVSAFRRGQDGVLRFLVRWRLENLDAAAPDIGDRQVVEPLSDYMAVWQLADALAAGPRRAADWATIPGRLTAMRRSTDFGAWLHAIVEWCRSRGSDGLGLLVDIRRAIAEESIRDAVPVERAVAAVVEARSSALQGVDARRQMLLPVSPGRDRSGAP